MSTRKPDPDPLKTLIARAHPAGWVPEPDRTVVIGHADYRALLNLEEESRLAGVRERIRNGHASHSDARFLLELLDRYMA
jgi:hypothetical protein